MPRLQIQCYCYTCRDDLIVSYEGSAQKEISCVSSCNRSLCETAINKKINQKKQMNTSAKKKWRQTKMKKKNTENVSIDINVVRWLLTDVKRNRLD